MKNITKMHILAFSLLIGGVIIGGEGEGWKQTLTAHLKKPVEESTPVEKSWFAKKRDQLADWNAKRKYRNVAEEAARKARVASEQGGSFLDHLRELDFKNYQNPFKNFSFKNPFKKSEPANLTDAEKNAVEVTINEVHPTVQTAIDENVAPNATPAEEASAAQLGFEQGINTLVTKAEGLMIPHVDFTSSTEKQIKEEETETLRAKLSRYAREAADSIRSGAKSVATAVSEFFAKVSDAVKSAIASVKNRIADYRENKKRIAQMHEENMPVSFEQPTEKSTSAVAGGDVGVANTPAATLA